VRCKDCSVGVEGKCPTCNVKLMICGEYDEIQEFKYWDNELNFCDGIDDG